jgi:hypothetical protein
MGKAEDPARRDRFELGLRPGDHLLVEVGLSKQIRCEREKRRQRLALPVLEPVIEQMVNGVSRGT